MNKEKYFLDVRNKNFSENIRHPLPCVCRRAAPYDFRYGPQSQAEYFTKMRGLVEEMYSTSGQPVTIISHSMGGLFGLYFLQQQSLAWLETHVKTFVPLNTPWRGAVIQLNTYARSVERDDIE